MTINCVIDELEKILTAVRDGESNPDRFTLIRVLTFALNTLIRVRRVNYDFAFMDAAEEVRKHKNR